MPRPFQTPKRMHEHSLEELKTALAALPAGQAFGFQATTIRAELERRRASGTGLGAFPQRLPPRRKAKR